MKDEHCCLTQDMIKYYEKKRVQSIKIALPYLCKSDNFNISTDIDTIFWCHELTIYFKKMTRKEIQKRNTKIPNLKKRNIINTQSKNSPTPWDTFICPLLKLGHWSRQAWYKMCPIPLNHSFVQVPFPTFWFAKCIK